MKLCYLVAKLFRAYVVVETLPVGATLRELSVRVHARSSARVQSIFPLQALAQLADVYEMKKLVDICCARMEPLLQVC